MTAAKVLLLFMHLLPQAVFSSEEQIPSSHAFVDWTDRSRDEGNQDPSEFAKIEFACADPMLYPTHPQSSLKRYHTSKYGNYNLALLKWDDEACSIPQPKIVPAHRRGCVRADALNFHILSDIYSDKCGNLYRGYWSVIFLTKNESMGTLVSRGRTVYPRAGSEFGSDLVDGGTYAVEVKSFLFLSEVSPDERAQIEKSRTEALGSRFQFDSNTLLFSALD